MFRRLPLAFSLLAVACTPKVSDTTHIHGITGGGTADKVSVYVLDYGIDESIAVIDGTFDYQLPTNPGIVATFTCETEGKRICQAVIPDGADLTLVFSPEGADLRSGRKQSVNYRLAEEEKLYQQWKAIAHAYMDLQRAAAPKEQLDSIAGRERPLMAQLKAFWREDLETQKDNYLSVKGLAALQGDLTERQKDSLIHTLDSTVIQTARVQMILKNTQARLRTQEGMPFVDFSVETETGPVRLSDYVGKGKYVLADFWASWCKPCLAEMPHLKDLCKQYGKSDFIILGIAASDEAQDSRKVIREFGLPWEQILGTGGIATEAYGIGSIPHMILFGPDGTILQRDLHGEKTDRVLEEYLRKN